MEEKNQNKQNNGAADYREPVEFFGSQFDKMHQEFGKIHQEFDKVYQILETKADKADMDEKFNLVLNRVAMINTKIDDYRAEQFAAQKQLDKHEKWHFKIAGKVGLNLLSE